jgi:hypothetical protein
MCRIDAGDVPGARGMTSPIFLGLPIADQPRRNQTGFDAVDLQRAINTSPKIGVLDINSSTKVLPNKIVLPPTWQRIGERADQVAIITQQRDARWPFDRLKTAYSG